MRAVAMSKGFRTSIFVLSGLGIVLGLSFVAERSAGGIAGDAVAALCDRLNIGGEGCGHAYLTKAGFDRVFADVEAASSLSLQQRQAFAEKLRVAGAKRVGPGEHPTALKTRIVDDMRSLMDVDATLHTSELDQATVFSLLLEVPTGSPAGKRMSSNSDPARSGT
jgi:hypothetical protein